MWGPHGRNMQHRLRKGIAADNGEYSSNDYYQMAPRTRCAVAQVKAVGLLCRLGIIGGSAIWFSSVLVSAFVS